MKISYAITVCNEYEEIQRLINFLRENKRQQDEIVILFDQKNGTEEVASWLTKQNKYPNLQFWRGFFEGHFADWKNKLTEYCKGDYIFQLDADEIVTKEFLNILPQIIEKNNSTDVFYIPRINTVEGLTQEHIQKWRWNINEKGWVNFPDYQMRLYRNSPEIKWVNIVHEKLEGFKTYIALPAVETYSMLHPKKIERQEKQNNLYSRIEANARTEHKV